MAVRRKHIRAVAETLLDKQNITEAPIPVDIIAKSLGLEIREEQADEDLSGFLYRDMEARTAIVGVNASHSPKRKRFTVAHELGHFLLHEGVTVHFDGQKPGITLNLRGAEAAMGTNDDEKEANLFAAELLMPAKFLERDFQDFKSDLMDEDALCEFAKKYQVSVQALTFRLANLGYIQL